jgi:hypothetical protein
MKFGLPLARLYLAAGCLSIAATPAALSQPNNLLAHHLVATGNHPFSPGAWVELNPCPLPPGGSVLDLANPANPVFSSTSNLRNTFQLVFGAEDIYGAVDFPASDGDGISPPNADGFFSFSGEDPMGHTFDVVAKMSVTGPNGPQDIADWVALNPCPLPPMPADAEQYPFRNQLPLGLLQIQFDPPSSVTALFSFTLSIDGGDPISFITAPIGVPEASPTLYLMVLGLGGLALMRLRSRLAG